MNSAMGSLREFKDTAGDTVWLRADNILHARPSNTGGGSLVTLGEVFELNLTPDEIAARLNGKS
jgi:hypothetical protein